MVEGEKLFGEVEPRCKYMHLVSAVLGEIFKILLKYPFKEGDADKIISSWLLVTQSVQP